MRSMPFICAALLCLGPLTAKAQIRTYEVPFPAPLRSPVDTVRLFIIGDVMMHMPQLKYDHTLFFEDIAPEMREADIAIANMEFSLGGEPYSGYPAFSAPDYIAPYMAACGTDVFLTANNHILDRGSKGLERTLGIYRSMADSVKFTGSAGSYEENLRLNPLMLRFHGISIALVNFTYDTNGITVRGWPNTNYQVRDSVKAAIGRAKAQEADFIIALPHWGEEYMLTHSKPQQEWAEWMAAEGVDAIIGGHPHVVQDTAHIGGVPVVYSLGNAVSNMSRTNTRLELAVRLTLLKDASTGETRVLEPELLPMWCTLPGRLVNGYKTIFIKKWASRRSDWLIPSDYDEMAATLERVSAATGITF